MTITPVNLEQEPQSSNKAHNTCIHNNVNPVIDSSKYALQVNLASIHVSSDLFTLNETQATDLVQISDEGVKTTAKYVRILSRCASLPTTECTPD